MQVAIVSHDTLFSGITKEIHLSMIPGESILQFPDQREENSHQESLPGFDQEYGRKHLTHESTI
jgi:hypothetical protein